MDFPIADVTLIYSTAGELRDVTVASLLPIDSAAVVAMVRDQCATAKDVKGAADLALGDWFSRVSQVELADRERYCIDSTVTSDHQRDDGLRSVTLRYSFKERK